MQFKEIFTSLCFLYQKMIYIYNVPIPDFKRWFTLCKYRRNYDILKLNLNLNFIFWVRLIWIVMKTSRDFGSRNPTETHMLWLYEKLENICFYVKHVIFLIIYVFSSFFFITFFSYLWYTCTLQKGSLNLIQPNF